MKAVTLFPEHAEAFRLGIRTIETRPRRCNYSGRIALHAGMRDPDSPAARSDPISRAVMDAIPHGDGLTRGAVVASAVLTDCVPIVGPITIAEHDRDERVVQVGADSGRAGLVHRYVGGGEVEADVSDQLPYGDYRPGRWALLLDDIKPTTERCPWCWGRGFEPAPEPYASQGEWPCRFCFSDGTSDPIPAKGQQAVPWEWTP